MGTGKVVRMRLDSALGNDATGDAKSAPEVIEAFGERNCQPLDSPMSPGADDCASQSAASLGPLCPLALKSTEIPPW